jgi:dTDP-4-amino-4,6-dideoxygalactose transaminase
MDASSSNDRIVRFSPPAIGPDEIREVVDTLESDWITTGPKVTLFEQRFRDHVGAPAALALNSCTAGLHLSLAALGVGPGDEVITSTLTFTSTVNVIEHVGARPVLVDVEADTLNLDPRHVARAITPRTKAIIAVHFAGHPADLASLSQIAARHNIALVEDAAHALPAAFDGRPVGSSANLTSFSFYATKNLTTAEGGMLTGDPALVDRARILSLHGMSRNAWNRYGVGGSWFYDVVCPGFKYNMTDIQAALGLVQLRRLESFQRRRGEIFAQYNQAFAGLSHLQLPACRKNVAHAWHLYVLRLNGPAASTVTQGGRDGLIAALKNRGICTSVHFIPVHMHTFYREKYGYQPDDFPVALDSYRRMLSLPLSPALTGDDVAHVIDGVRDAMAGRELRKAG